MAFAGFDAIRALDQIRTGGDTHSRGIPAPGPRRSNRFEAISTFPAPMFATTCWNRNRPAPKCTARNSKRRDRIWIAPSPPMRFICAAAKSGPSGRCARISILIGVCSIRYSNGRPPNGRTMATLFSAMKSFLAA